MRSTKSLLFLLTLGLAAGGYWFWEPAVEAFGGRRHGCYQPCCPQPCFPQPCIVVQYVQVPGGGGQAEVDPKSKKVKFLVILDTEDKRIGTQVMNESKRLEVLFSSLPRHLRGPIEFIQGTDLTAENVFETIRRMPVGKNETLFCYCNLHGQEKEKEQILQIRGAPDGDYAKGISRHALLEALQRKGAYLTILVTDSCFHGTGTKPAEVEDFGVVVKPATVDEDRPPDAFFPANNATQVLADLLVNHKGVVNINSASEGQYAFSDIFTPAFVNLVAGKPELGEPVLPPGEVTWAIFFENLKKATEARFAKIKASPRAKSEMKGEKVDQTPDNFGQQLPEFVRGRDSRDDWESSVADGATATPSETSSGEETATAPASIQVNLPPTAKLFIDDAATRQTSSPRFFQTPEIPVNKDSFYTFRAELVVNGKKLAESKQVKVRGGETSAVTFEDLRAEAPAAARPAEITVRLPADAQLFVDDKLSSQTEPTRVLQTPPLEADRDYTLDLKVRVPRGGQTETLHRRVDLKAGQRVEVDFTTEKTAALAARP
jgi:uncharacterized protein (TIGR03000 family)